jgi:hypothetical protein
MQTAIKLSNVKPGEFIRLKNSDTAPVWKKGHFDRTSKTYSLTKADDMNAETFRKGSVTVFVGFTY